MRPFLLFLLCFVLSNESIAEVYRYRDSSGKVHYVSEKDQVPAQYRSQLTNAPKLPNIGKIPSKTYENTNARASFNKPVVLVMRGCGYCNALEKMLHAKEISYTKYDIHKSRKGAMMYDQLGRGGVPITKIGSTVIRGYQPYEILRVLGQ